MWARSVAELARSWVRSRRKTLEGLSVEAAEALREGQPEMRFAALNRILLEVGHLEKREPGRALALRAALLDLIVETLQLWAGRDSALAVTLHKMTSMYADQRTRIDGDEGFEDEVDAVRSSLRA